VQQSFDFLRFLIEKKAAIAREPEKSARYYKMLDILTRAPKKPSDDGKPPGGDGPSQAEK